MSKTKAPSKSAVALIQNEADLNDFVESVQQQSTIAIDTEFVREKTYFPQPGLIQIAAAGKISCIDPVLISDLSSFYRLLSNPSIVKILHAAGQDLELFQVMSAVPVEPVFDTQIAADFLNEGNQIGYAGLVEKRTGIVLAKDHTRTNWLARPLSSDQIQYAADDVRYLEEIYHAQRSVLAQSGRLSWLEEDCALMVEKQQQKPSADGLLLRIKGHYELSGVHRSIARELAIWREKAAQKRDLPRRWILADDVMVRLARSKVNSSSELSRFDGLTAAQHKQYADGIMAAIETGKTLQESDWPLPAKNSRPKPETTKKLKQIKSELVKIAAREDINPALFANRKALEQLIEGDSDIALMRGWRYELAGKQIEMLLDSQPVNSN